MPRRGVASTARESGTADGSPSRARQTQAGAPRANSLGAGDPRFLLWVVDLCATLDNRNASLAM